MLGESIVPLGEKALEKGLLFQGKGLEVMSGLAEVKLN